MKQNSSSRIGAFSLRLTFPFYSKIESNSGVTTIRTGFAQLVVSYKN